MSDEEQRDEGRDADVVVSLTTDAKPGIPVEIDAVRYELKTQDHLSHSDEINLRTLYARENRLNERLETLAPEQESQIDKTNEDLRTIRIRMITLMSSIPREIVEKLSVAGQLELVVAIGKNRA